MAIGKRGDGSPGLSTDRRREVEDYSEQFVQLGLAPIWETMETSMDHDQN